MGGAYGFPQQDTQAPALIIIIIIIIIII